MKSKMKRILAIIVCISFILTFLPINSVSFAKPRYDVWKDKIKVYDVDKKIKAAEAEYEGYKYIATLDKDTNEIKLKVKPTAAKKFDKSLDTLSPEERNFSIKVEYFDGENLKAKLIDEKTKEEYNIGDSDTVSAQFAIAIPIALGLAEALIASLLLIGKVIELFGEKYVEASEVIENVKNNKYEYYKAAIKNGILYIGPAIDYPTAFTRVYNFELDVFCKNKSLAYTLAQNVANSFPFGGFVRGPDKDGYSSIYFYHYHVYKYITSSFVYKLPCHIFFP
ncbi:hypothetical protein B0S90_0533 [Caldicellulosiruptor bescii]|uniref:Uncharacterized protein n=2 Tax=Caldicellulosiruptor bescii TaxID=31899 RepID=B9MMI1_CALBD|nr:hypothetical protein [Caldicellulosiruptor bescii]ACM59413.1 hypothetical protein Athe_0264 [Caldicellulosiruptor bescii DSM 6725]PBC88133.1 hypothetical protein B0S87_1092 [Caldicellulosiruptor bescii]PBC89772.1 hypothetical protein B0S89_0037 [Caldicellulosiruptor bescii]PBD04802.1 hypothetical protein B0S85_2508 [Caldicellulosiruptor bescii]PBD05567.1 hypothetical protein B0S90_0533 [Caldicellulosiruptor bescii]